MSWLQNPKREWNEAIFPSTLEEGIMALLTSRTLIKLLKKELFLHQVYPYNLELTFLIKASSVLHFLLVLVDQCDVIDVMG